MKHLKVGLVFSMMVFLFSCSTPKSATNNNTGRTIASSEEPACYNPERLAIDVTRDACDVRYIYNPVERRGDVIVIRQFSVGEPVASAIGDRCADGVATDVARNVQNKLRTAKAGIKSGTQPAQHLVAGLSVSERGAFTPCTVANFFGESADEE